MRDEKLAGYSYRYEFARGQYLNLVIKHEPYKDGLVRVTKIANLKSIFDRHKAPPTDITIKKGRFYCMSSHAFEVLLNQGLKKVEEFIENVENRLATTIGNKNIATTPALWVEVANEVIKGNTTEEILMKFCEFGRVYANNVRLTRKSIRYSMNLLNTIEKFETFLEGDISFQRLNTRKLMDFKEYLTYRHTCWLKPTTIAMHLQNLQAIYNAACKKFNIDNILIDTSNSPFKFLEKGEKSSSRLKQHTYTPRVKQFLANEELDKIAKTNIESKKRINAVDLEMYKQVMLFHNEVGNRISDLCTMTVQDVFLNREKYGVYFETMRKTGNPVAVKLTKKAREIIDTFLVGKNNEDFVFPLLEQKEYTEEELVKAIACVTEKYNRALRQITEQTGLMKHITSHSARKRVANTGTRLKAQSMLGHKSAKVLDNYRDIITDLDYEV